MEEALVSIRDFFEKYPMRVFSRGEIIASSGDEIKSVFYIRSGIARSFYIDENGDELTINLLKPFSFFPLSAVLAGKNNAYDFQAFTKVEVNVSPVNEVLKYLNKNSDFKSVLLKTFSIGLEGYLIRSFFLIKGSATQKVASSLMMLAKRFGGKNGNSIIIDLPLTHQDIANLAGITRETTSIHIEILEKERIISRKGRKTLILDYPGLTQKATIGEDGNLLDFSF